MNIDLTTGSVLKRLITFAFPILGANLLQALYGTADMMIVGLFTDASAVSAVSTGSMTLHTITCAVIGLTMGCTILLGNNIGMKNYKGAAKTIGSAIGLYVILGVVLTAVVAMFANPLATIMNAPEEAFLQTASYIRICGIGIICIVLFNSLCSIFRGLGDSRTPFILMLIACVCNVIGDLLLVGAAHMGSDGAAIATVTAQGISVVAAFFIIRKRGFGFASEKGDMKPAKRETALIVKYGIPIAVQELLTGLSFMILLAILNSFGVIASAGVGIAEKLCALMFIIPGGFMAAVSAFTAQNVGAGKIDRTRKGVFYSIVITVVLGTVLFLVSFWNGVGMAHLFSPDMDVCIAAGDYLRSYAVDLTIVGINFSLMGYFNGNGKTIFVATQGLLSTFLVRIPVAFFMSKIPGVSLFQIGFATPLATVFAIVLSVIYLIYFEKNRKKTQLI